MEFHLVCIKRPTGILPEMETGMELFLIKNPIIQNTDAGITSVPAFFLLLPCLFRICFRKPKQGTVCYGMEFFILRKLYFYLHIYFFLIL